MSTKPRTDAERVQYLVRALQINPLQDAESLLSLRRDFHGSATDRAREGRHETTDVRRSREVVVEQLDRLRENFWTMNSAELQQSLQSIRADSFPDLQLAVKRMQTLAEYRPSLARVTQQPAFDSDLFSSLKRVLVLPPREAEGVREKTLKSITTRAVQKKIQRMVALLRREAPQVYALEQGWFDRLTSSKVISAGAIAVARESSDSGGIGLGGLGWAGGVILLIILRLVLKGLSWGMHE